ncbi:DUF2190 family protein [Phytoactinopolyspora limicola]|uniref:DUF2190 family protein n=1 Tax=Phytoactinopolyspora limicola TaxID=2715536 RepID=UPI00140DC4F5|nr:DUF2190 family protein [Phytoactinopolyspora limicola]
MATNSAFHLADQLSLPVPAGTESNDPVKVGDLVGVALTDRGTEGNEPTHATVKLTGAFHLVVDGAIADVGDPVYIDGDGDLTATASGNDLFGHALETKGVGEGEIPVKIAAFSVPGGA